MAQNYKIVRLKNGVCSLHSMTHAETCHPVVGPVIEAENLYIRQLRLHQRLRAQAGQFEIWDVGLGGAANILTLLRATRDVPCSIRIVSFDQTIELLEFGLEHAGELEYFAGYEDQVREVLQKRSAKFSNGAQQVSWNLLLDDFPSWLAQFVSASATAEPLSSPDLILFDPYSPAKNPAMWTQSLFENLRRAIDSPRSCLMPTYSRSTMFRVTLLLAGFFVGVGGATGEKEETTIAATDLSMLERPLDERWLERVKKSDSAEPLLEPVYHRAPISAASWRKLLAHPQFHSNHPG
jgi:tRNA U34 5-methylaminomethyl-2-thiouridine-forming methyltransferase MnmC